MVLIDTSVWIDHFYKTEPDLQELLYQEQVISHPFIIGELACGSMRNRDEILRLLNDLPKASAAEHKEVLFLISEHKLFGKGLGYIDIHLLSAALLGNYVMWTKDKKLSAIADQFGVNYIK